MNETLEKSIIKEFGEHIIRSGNSVVDTELVVVPISPCLDIILGGGIPEGSFVIFTGQPKCGKTTSTQRTQKIAMVIDRHIASAGNMMDITSRKLK